MERAAGQPLNPPKRITSFVLAQTYLGVKLRNLEIKSFLSFIKPISLDLGKGIESQPLSMKSNHSYVYCEAFYRPNWHVLHSACLMSQSTSDSSMSTLIRSRSLVHMRVIRQYISLVKELPPAKLA